MIGEIAVRTKGNLQLAGLATKYLGRTGGIIMALVKYSSGVGVKVIYIIGIGQSLSIIFGGPAFWWSIIFTLLAAVLIYNGVGAIKTVDLVLSLIILFVILLIAGFSFDHIAWINFQHYDLAHLLLPYGVILFAFHGGPAVVETHSILAKNKKSFKTENYPYKFVCSNYSEINNKELMEFQKYFYKKYYLNPKFITKFIIKQGIFAALNWRKFMVDTLKFLF